MDPPAPPEPQVTTRRIAILDSDWTYNKVDGEPEKVPAGTEFPLYGKNAYKLYAWGLHFPTGYGMGEMIPMDLLHVEEETVTVTITKTRKRVNP